MWRDLEEEAIQIGLDLNYFWSLNLKQYEKHRKAYIKVQEEELKKQDALNWVLGKYISFSFHEPNKYPRKPFTKEDKQENQTNEDMELNAMLITAQLGGTINGSNNN